MPTILRPFLVAGIVAALLVPATLAFASPTGYVAYEADGTVQIGTVDVGAGAPSVTNVGSTGEAAASAAVTGVALAPSGVLYAIDDEGDRLLTINPATGALVDSVDLDIDTANAQPVVTTDGTVYVAASSSLFEVNLSTGHATERAEFPVTVTSAAARCIDENRINEVFAFAPSTKQLYHVALPSFTVTPLPQTLGSIAVNSTKLSFDFDGTLWGMNVNVSPPTIMTIDTTTGAATAVGAGGVTGYYGLAIGGSLRCPGDPLDNIPDIGPPPTTPVPVTPNFTG